MHFWTRTLKLNSLHWLTLPILDILCGIALVMMSDGDASPWGLDVALAFEQVPFICPLSHIYKQQQWRQKGNNRFVMKMRSKNWVSDSSAIQFFQKSEEGLRHNGQAWVSVHWPHYSTGWVQCPPLHMPAPPACSHLARTCQLMTYCFFGWIHMKQWWKYSHLISKNGKHKWSDLTSKFQSESAEITKIRRKSEWCCRCEYGTST